ncbi:MAG: hypothetical protein AAB595_01330 [Patescibacteria group bacterium]
MKKNLNLISYIVLLILIAFILIYYFQSQKHLTPKTINPNNHQQIDNIEQQMLMTKSKYALLMPSQNIDEYPVWSEDSQSIYVNEEGQWKKISLSQVRLDPGIWHNDIPIGINNKKKSIITDSISQGKLDTLLSRTPHDPRNLILPNGTQIQLNQDLFATSFKITLPNQNTRTEWTTDLENCYDIVLSPNQRYILFKCELNGVFLMKIN